MMSHRAVLSTISGILVLLEELGQKMGPDDVYLSFLPLAHIFDRVVEELMLRWVWSGGYLELLLVSWCCAGPAVAYALMCRGEGR
jgi:long-subunit acyl-CoA synthetase (AMP-forming)